MPADFPAQSVVERLLSEYAPTRLKVDTSRLSTADIETLRRLTDAARGIDRIFWKQRSHTGAAMLQQASHSSAAPAMLQRLLALNFGPWHVFDDDRPFWGTARRPSGGTAYPADLTRQELDAYIAAHPADRDALLNPATVVERRDARLHAIPYHVAFHDDLQDVARSLEAASRSTTDAAFARYLRERAAGLLSGHLEESERLWVGLADSALDMVVGPLEVYDDGFRGVKTSYEATVLLRHPDSARIREYEALLPELGDVLPGAVAMQPRKGAVRAGIYDVVFTGGSTNMGAKAVAAMLPNDAAIRRRSGSRLLLFRNVLDAKFSAILQPICERVIAPAQAALVQSEVFLLHTLFHELAHALATPPDEHRPASEQLGERYSPLEECRADLVAVMLIQRLAERRVLPLPLLRQAAMLLVAGSVRVLRFGEMNDYGRAAAMILSQFTSTGALGHDAEGRISVDLDRAIVETSRLAARIQDIQNRGDYTAAGALLDTLARVPERVAALLPRLQGLPVDIEFEFDPVLGG